jgi:Cas6b C-terminal domain/Cas6b N-terminal domain
MEDLQPLQQIKRIRLLQVSFETSIQPYELSAFRGAVAASVGLEHEWFHNHDRETGGFHNRYPLVQYKLETLNGKMKPMLLFIEAAIEEAQLFFNRPDWTLTILGTRHPLQIAQLNVRQHALGVWEKPFLYRIHKWMAFESRNFKQWQQLEGIVQKIAFLEKKLQNQLLGFATGLDWQIQTLFSVTIIDLKKEEWISFKSHKMLIFTLDFKTHLSLPDYVGIGNGANQGFGVIREQFFKR